MLIRWSNEQQLLNCISLSIYRYLAQYRVFRVKWPRGHATPFSIFLIPLYLGQLPLFIMFDLKLLTLVTSFEDHFNNRVAQTVCTDFQQISQHFHTLATTQSKDVVYFNDNSCYMYCTNKMLKSTDMVPTLQ